MTAVPSPVPRPGDNRPPPDLRVALVAPSYNHDRAVGGVLAGLARYGLPVIVVNDGATDNTASVLDQWKRAGVGEARHTITHPVNMGKAAALRSGFAEAARLGFTHAATIDTDGQHDPADLRELLDASAACSSGLIIGARVREGSSAPWASRIGRLLSNRLVWLESGVSVTDSQSGMRVYPLASMPCLTGSSSRYGFETEVITLAGWLSVPVIERPIRNIYCVPGGRATHFRLCRDTFAAVGMHARLLVRALSLGPVPLNQSDQQATGTVPRRLGSWFSLRRLRRMACGDSASQERLAASIGVGLLMATLPLYGVKTVICLWISGRFRLHPLAVLGTSSLSTPPLGLVFVALSISVGGLLVHGSVPDLGGIGLGQSAQWSTVNTLIVEWLLGSVIAGAGLGLLGYSVVRALLMRPWRPRATSAGGAGS